MERMKNSASDDRIINVQLTHTDLELLCLMLDDYWVGNDISRPFIKECKKVYKQMTDLADVEFDRVYGTDTSKKLWKVVGKM